MYFIGSTSWNASAGNIARISAPPAPSPFPVMLIKAQSNVDLE